MHITLYKPSIPSPCNIEQNLKYVGKYQFYSMSVRTIISTMTLLPKKRVLNGIFTRNKLESTLKVVLLYVYSYAYIICFTAHRAQRCQITNYSLNSFWKFLLLFDLVDHRQCTCERNFRGIVSIIFGKFLSYH